MHEKQTVEHKEQTAKLEEQIAEDKRQMAKVKELNARRDVQIAKLKELLVLLNREKAKVTGGIYGYDIVILNFFLKLV